MGKRKYYFPPKAEKKPITINDDVKEELKKLADKYGWSASLPNLSGKLRRGSLRYHEAVELADALGYDIVWQRRIGER